MEVGVGVGVGGRWVGVAGMRGRRRGGASVRAGAGKGGEGEAWGLGPAESTSGRGALGRGDVEVGVLRGEGSFGTVFEGTLLRDRRAGKVVAGGTKGDAVILKRARARVQDAGLALELELRLNEAAQGRAPGACAPFLGGIRVPEDAGGARGARATPVRGELGPGLWLVWAKEGTRTLDGYLRAAGAGRGGLEQLALVLGVAGSAAAFRAAPVASELAAVRALMRDVLGSLAALHAGHIVHRDVKPENVLVCGGAGVGDAAAAAAKAAGRGGQGGGRLFRLIDLGSAACFVTGTNVENDTRTPAYAPPEETVVPPGTPPSKKSFSEWEADRFDSFSAGVVLLQASVPALRKGGAELTRFRDQLTDADYDVAAWRAAHPRASASPLLDAGGGAGWDLAAGLLAGVAVDVRTKASGKGMDAKRFRRVRSGRLDAASALAHDFFTFDAAEGVVESGGGGGPSGLLRTLFGA